LGFLVRPASDTLGASGFDPVELAPRVPSQSPGGSPSPSASPSRTGVPGDLRATRSASATPSATRPAAARPRPSSPATGQPTPTATATPAATPKADDILRMVSTDGGRATVSYADGRVHLLNYLPAPGFRARAFRQSNDSIVIRFVGLAHVSTVHAYVDRSRSLRASVVEEDA
jgi:hypothetical protein